MQLAKKAELAETNAPTTSTVPEPNSTISEEKPNKTAQPFQLDHSAAVRPAVKASLKPNANVEWKADKFWEVVQIVH